MKKLFIIAALLILIISTGCNKSFLEVPATTGVTLNELSNKAGVQQLLAGAYHDLGGLTPKSSWWSSSGTNWIYGDVAAGDAYRGGYAAKDDAIIKDIQLFQSTSSTSYLADKFRAVYDGVARSNNVIQGATAATDMSEAEKTKAIAEARFLRGHFHFEAKKMWNKVPYIDENVKDFKVSNDADIWPNIEADFKFAFDNLPAIQEYKGAANKWAAACYLAKAYMFEKKFTEARALLNTIIPPAYGGSGTGVTAQGAQYALMPNFDDNFNGDFENGPEHVFQIQFSANDGGNGGSSNLGELCNVPSFYPVTAYYLSWKQPSYNLVNAFKTDNNGLPLLDTYNDENMKNDAGVSTSDFTYTTYQGNVDPRLDWTVSRRGVIFLDWTDGYSYNAPTYAPANPGYWVNDASFGGPYTPVKTTYRQSNAAKFAENQAQYYLVTSAVNVSIIRFADVLLWAAECEVEAGSLERARQLVNYVRDRAKTGRAVEVSYNDYSGYAASANYKVDTYNAVWTDQATARKEVQFERRIELALEGHRFFDLVRWGLAGDFISKYLQKEIPRLPASLTGASFTPNKNEYFPIPQTEIDLSAVGGKPLLKQNTGYN